MVPADDQVQNMSRPSATTLLTGRLDMFALVFNDFMYNHFGMDHVMKVTNEIKQNRAAPQGLNHLPSTGALP